MRRSRADSEIPKGGEKTGDRFPHILATRKAAPLRANQANQPVAFVDGHDEIFVRLTQPVDEQSLNIIGHPLQRRVLVNNVLPRVNAKMSFGCTCWTGIKGCRLSRIPDAAEESHVDGDREFLPLGVVHYEITQRSDISGNTTITSGRLVAKKNGASLATASNLAGFQLQKMMMAIANIRPAKFTLCARGRTRAHESAQLPKYADGLSIVAHDQNQFSRSQQMCRHNNLKQAAGSAYRDRSVAASAN
jgi:hypothetical protein